MSQASNNAPFVWPPARGGAVTPARTLPRGGRGEESGEVRLAPPRPRGGRWRVWLREIERVWLGVTSRPLEARAADLHWEADALSAFCPRCGRSSGPYASASTGCPKCREARSPVDRVVRLGRYAPPLSGWVHEVKFARSRHAGRQLGALLGRQIGLAALAPETATPTATSERSPATPTATRFILVPVPTPWRRRLARGIDHPAVLARAVAEALRREGSTAEVQPVLARAYRPMQTRSGAQARGQNVHGSMWVRGVAWGARVRAGWMARAGAGVGRWARLGRAGPGARLADLLRALSPTDLASTVVVLVDDVTTTGATLREAARALRQGLKAAGSPPVRCWCGVVAVTEEEG